MKYFKTQNKLHSDISSSVLELIKGQISGFCKQLYSSLVYVLIFSLFLIPNSTFTRAENTAPTIFIGPGGIIINEFSNGPSGSKEWVELLVVGDPTNPSANVDLAGWIFDDNNGDFEGSTGTGVATGYLSFDATYNSITPGTIILIYNQNDIDPSLPPADPTDVNNDGVYVIPSDHPSLTGCNIRPSTSDPTYMPCTLTTSSWNRVAQRNSGDVPQVRQPDGTFYHGFSFGDVGSPFPNFPSGTTSFNAGTGGVGSTFSLQCGDWESPTQYLRSTASGRTPGLPNSSANEIMIDRIINGNFDYTNLAASNNCIKCKQNICLPISYTFK